MALLAQQGDAASYENVRKLGERLQDVPQRLDFAHLFDSVFAFSGMQELTALLDGYVNCLTYWRATEYPVLPLTDVERPLGNEPY